MTTCYCCSSKAVHAVNLRVWKPVCEFHSTEAIEEEGPIQIMTIERWEATQNEHRTAS